MDTATGPAAARKRDQSRPLGYTQQRKRDAAFQTVTSALRQLHASREALRQLLDLRLTTDGVRDRAADIAEAHAGAERELLRALVVLQSMTDNTVTDLGAILGPGE